LGIGPFCAQDGGCWRPSSRRDCCGCGEREHRSRFGASTAGAAQPSRRRGRYQLLAITQPGRRACEICLIPAYLTPASTLVCPARRALLGRLYAVKAIDSHVHLMKFRPNEHVWVTDDMPELCHDFLPTDLDPLLTAAGFDSCIAVEAPRLPLENEWLVGLASQWPRIAAVVGWVDFRAHDIGTQLDQLDQHSIIKGAFATWSPMNRRDSWTTLPAGPGRDRGTRQTPPRIRAAGAPRTTPRCRSARHPRRRSPRLAPTLPPASPTSISSWTTPGSRVDRNRPLRQRLGQAIGPRLPRPLAPLAAGRHPALPRNCLSAVQPVAADDRIQLAGLPAVVELPGQHRCRHGLRLEPVRQRADRPTIGHRAAVLPDLMIA